MNCFCTGECQRLGYCPHQIFGTFPKFCKDCGIPMNDNSIYDKCSRCRNMGTVSSPVVPLNYINEENDDYSLEVEDEIWYKKGGKSTVHHDKVLEIKENVIKVKDAEDVTASSYWRELDNIRIFEVEKQNNNDE